MSITTAALIGLGGCGVPSPSSSTTGTDSDGGHVASSASGLTTPSAPLAGSSFEGDDGNLVVDLSVDKDWANVTGVATGIDQPSGSSDNAFGQGTKEDGPDVTVVDGSIPPNKNDLTRFYVASEYAGGDNFLYLAWERLVNIGNANLDFEINQNATANFNGTTTGALTLNRTAGDLLITYDFGGSGKPTLGINVWLTAAHNDSATDCFASQSLPCWGKHVTLGSADSSGAVNTVQVTDPLNNNASLGIGLFGEAEIDLTKAGVFPAGTCLAFGSAFVKSRSSSSFTAEIKDFIAPQPVNVSNCGTIKIIKHTDARGIDQDFSFTSNITGATSFTLNDKGNTSSDGTGNTKTITGLAAGSFTVTEGTEPAHYVLESLSCTATGTGTSASQHAAGSMQADITLGAGGTVTCTYTNQHQVASPTIATVLSATSTSVGSSVNDTSTLSGATSDAGGTVTYTVYTDSACSQGAISAGTKTVTNGVVPNSDSVTFATAGTYYWQAVYSGDANNSGATSPCTSEILTVTKNSPTISTAQKLLPNDDATISGATSNAGGTVTFQLFDPSDATCAGTPAYTETVTVSGNGTYSTSNSTVFATTAGTWRWKVVYSGDANNVAATDACGVENFTITNQ